MLRAVVVCVVAKPERCRRAWRILRPRSMVLTGSGARTAARVARNVRFRIVSTKRNEPPAHEDEGRSAYAKPSGNRVSGRPSPDRMDDRLPPGKEEPRVVGPGVQGKCGLGCGERIRTSDLRVMSPTSCRCSTPRPVTLGPAVHSVKRHQRQAPSGGPGASTGRLVYWTPLFDDDRGGYLFACTPSRP